ncbi:MAG TPA: hypothetical protein VFY42_03160 [Gemmatimonadales bacterium]|nr:hypothetical protein [Gemmatimonadales bacterium]
MLSPSGLPEVPCAKCGRRLSGLRWGDLCPDCRAQRERRASRLGHRISLAATVLMAVYVALRVPADPTARLYGAVATLATYIIVRRIATRVAMEYLK